MAVCLACAYCHAQQKYFQISGTVVDAKGQSPVAGATVYLSNTTIGTVTSETGVFTLDHVPPGNYKLIASFLGYKTLSVAVSESNKNEPVALALHQDVNRLKGITVRAKRRKDKHRKNYFELFKQCFIGTDDNAASCKILNPNVLYYNYKTDLRTFTVHASEPLIIINQALGYKIYYDLASFTYDFGSHHIVYFGYPRFEPLVTTDLRQSADWENNRVRTYQQSKRFFMLMLKGRQLADKGFEVNKLIRVNKDSLPPLPIYSTREIEEMLHENAPIPQIDEPVDTMYPNQEPYDSIIGAKNDSNYVRLKFSHSLRILVPAPSIKNATKAGLTVFKINEGKYQQAGRNDNKHSTQKPGPSVSIITMTRPETFIDPNGVLTDPLAITVEGAWAHMQMADLLPFDYRPTE